MVINEYAFNKTPSMFANIENDDIDIFFSRIISVQSNGFDACSTNAPTFAVTGYLKDKTIKLLNIKNTKENQNQALGTNAFQGVLAKAIIIGNVDNHIDCSNWQAPAPFTGVRQTMGQNGNDIPSVTYYHSGDTITQEIVCQKLFGLTSYSEGTIDIIT